MLFRLKKAAAELNLSERFIRQLIAENAIPFYKLSARSIMVDIDEIKAMMRSIAKGEQKPIKLKHAKGGTGKV